ncbi:hypothetical protein PFICI_09250 [Pestalotiopsis fici W106-1]|uniref:Uncharacterized protein n=1 Tax=Pestalotiopsis fici (strain W106-1 / CGMCC3.15140) TaxID=1229662 RepID=W3X1Z8_PESFW|nr:uncharacterized protein PFICI_09250 [Pestalotiopsis fici W106-1]ETS79397.1 hypothetical protein PFICI_09250 [Pestalotiopsis fici W106-1]
MGSFGSVDCAYSSPPTLRSSTPSSQERSISCDFDRTAEPPAGLTTYAHIGTWISACSLETATNRPQQLDISSAQEHPSLVPLPLYDNGRGSTSPTLCRYLDDYDTVPVNEKLLAKITFGTPMNNVT